MSLQGFRYPLLSYLVESGLGRGNEHEPSFQIHMITQQSILNSIRSMVAPNKGSQFSYIYEELYSSCR